jgi:hypothetical protein
MVVEILLRISNYFNENEKQPDIWVSFKRFDLFFSTKLSHDMQDKIWLCLENTQKLCLS